MLTYATKGDKKMYNEQDRKFYDEAFMEVFSNKKIVKSLLEDFVKEQWVDLIDFSSMKATKSIPNFRYILIDIARFSDALLVKLKDAVSFFFLLDKTDTKKKDKASTRIINILKELQSEDPEIFKLQGRYISGLLRYKGIEIVTINDYLNERGESMLAQSLDELKEEGRLEGKLEGKMETAKNMLEEGLDIQMISHITGLSISKIEKL